MNGIPQITLESDGQIITVTPRISQRIKNIRISIHPVKGVELVIRKISHLADAKKFLLSKKDWIISKITSLNVIKLEKRKIAIGSIIPILGHDYQIVSSNYLRGKIKLENSQIIVPGLAEYIPAKVNSFLIKLLKEVIEKQLAALLPRLDTKYNKIFIKDTKTRWGSCSRQGNLSFNFRLVFAPKFVLYYLIVHEACHLKQFNHSKQFWALVASHDPDYKNAISWLRINGKILHSYN